MGLRPLVGIRFQVLFHSPNRGSFHLSLALLFTIGHQVVLSLARWAALIHARFHGTGATRELRRRAPLFDYGAITLCGLAFQPARLKDALVTPSHIRNCAPGSHNTARATPAGYHTRTVWALPFSIASTGGVDVSFLSCRYLDGSVPCVPYRTLWIHVRLTRVFLVSFPNLGYLRFVDCLRLPEAFRSLATSFVGSWCLGILTYTLSSLILFSLEIPRRFLSTNPTCQRACRTAGRSAS